MAYSLEKPNAQQVVYSLYLALLEREPDLAGFEYHVKRLTSGEMTESKLASEFLRSPEFCAKHGTLIEKHTGEYKSYSTVALYSKADLEIFSEFDRSRVKPSEGFLTEWIGSRVRLSSLWSSLRPQDFDNKVLPLPIPGDYHSDAIEWIGTLKAVLAARDSFSVMELGAGGAKWRRWFASSLSSCGSTDSK